MPGLGQRLLGAALVGAGAGIVQQAQQRREETLAQLRRKWQVEDRTARANLTREGWDRADARARMGSGGEPLVPVVENGRTVYKRRSDAVGGTVPGKQQKPQRPVQVVLGYDEDGNEIKGHLPPDEAIARARKRMGETQTNDANEAANANVDAVIRELEPSFFERIAPGDDFAERWGMSREDMKAVLVDKLRSAFRNSPGASEERIVAQVVADVRKAAPAGQRRQRGTVEAATPQPPKDYPNAQLAPNGRWYVRDGDKWREVMQ